MAPKVSIIVPVFNMQSYLAKCLDSLIAQTLTDIEIIAVNDGSTDNSSAILSEYAARERRIVVIDQENCGQGHARNRAIEAASGEYIGFIDPDDFVSADYFEALYLGAKRIDADICATCGVITVDEISGKIGSFEVGFRSRGTIK
ncbi:hypothetical protein AGMMS50229_05110 [Campylobacterota bacterium]|nr:hypothetical protein AGMMS50229_05110 [Campylobacterota bacterium]